VSLIVDTYTDITPDGWVWCCDCMRAYQAFEHARPNGIQKCPYVGCEGDYLDIEKWADVRKLRPNYPVVPTRNKVYILEIDPLTQFLV